MLLKKNSFVFGVLQRTATILQRTYPFATDDILKHIFVSYGVSIVSMMDILDYVITVSHCS